MTPALQVVDSEHPPLLFALGWIPSQIYASGGMGPNKSPRRSDPGVHVYSEMAIGAAMAAAVAVAAVESRLPAMASETMVT